tara:strand:- start:146 stop:670 length:525 start_codon:yes stop_codon:yes gene_type:complete
VFAGDYISKKFEIGGMSIGDSLLDYFSKTEIINAYNYDHLPSSMKFRIIDLETTNNFFDGFQFYYIPDDKNFIIQSLNGRRLYYDDINECYKKFDEIVENLSTIFKNAKKTEKKSIKQVDDPSGEFLMTFFELDSGGKASVTCYNWSSEVEYIDSLGVSIQSKEVRDWVNNDYF